MAEAAVEHPSLRNIHDFLDWVVRQEGRYEFVDGRIRAMAGASRRHNDLQMRLIFMLMGRLRSGPCRVAGPDLLIRTDPRHDRRGRFADAVIEGEPPTHHRLIDAPLVIFEILSPDTAAVDRGEKLLEYQALPSLRHYVLIEQELPRIEHYARLAEPGQWLYRVLEGLDAVLDLDPPGVALPMAELWQGVG